MQDQQNNTGTGTSGRRQMGNGGSAVVGMALASGLAFVLFIAPGPLSHGHHQSATPTTNSARQQ